MRRGIYLLIPLLVVSSGISTTGPAMRLYGKPVQILPRRSWSSTSLGFFVYFTKAPQKWGKPALPYLSRGFVIRALRKKEGEEENSLTAPFSPPSDFSAAPPHPASVVPSDLKVCRRFLEADWEQPGSLTFLSHPPTL